MTMTIMATPNDLARSRNIGRKQGSCSGPYVIVGLPLRQSRTQSETGRMRSPGLGLAFFIDTQNDGFLRRFVYSPTISRTFSTKSGSVLNLKLLTRCGFKP